MNFNVTAPWYAATRLFMKKEKKINIRFFFFSFNENFVKTNFTFILLNAWQSIDIILRLINQSFLPQGGAAPLCPWIKIDDCIIDLYFELIFFRYFSELESYRIWMRNEKINSGIKWFDSRPYVEDTWQGGNSKS